MITPSTLGFLLAVCLIAQAFFVCAEVALSACDRNQLHTRAEAGDARARRAELQNTIPPGRAPRVAAEVRDIATGPIGAPGPAVLDPPPRPIHVVDEVTPPATDIAELVRGGQGDDRGRSS